jgi:hypothetical protein
MISGLADSKSGRKLVIFCAMTAFALSIASGCANRRQYTVTLRDDQVIYARTRPKVDKETQMYRFKDAAGRRIVVPAYHVREIEIR